nr:macro domain-containing protein [uncultured Pseudodesulfovibrio sp.]
MNGLAFAADGLIFRTIMQTWNISAGRLIIRQGDITTLSVDAIVNAANNQLAGGGGVDGAIHRAAGLVKLQTACQDIVQKNGPLPTGKAVITPGFGLPSHHIIHTVGPVWHGGKNDEPAKLGSAYEHCLKLAHAHAIGTIAFPAISCGVYGYPVEDAARIALPALKHGLEANMVREISMVLHDDAAYDIWTAIAKEVL